MQIRPMKFTEAETVRDLWNEACVKAVGYPLPDKSAHQVLLNLRDYPQNETYHCLVAEEDDQIVAFLTFGVRGHPIGPGLVGEIEELYAQSGYDQAKLAMVTEAVITMKRQGARVVTTRVAVDEPDDLAFWHSLKWEQDTVNFNIYSNVPADPESQAVWDSYQA